MKLVEWSLTKIRDCKREGVCCYFLIVPCGIVVLLLLKSVNSGVILSIFCKYIDGNNEKEQYAQQGRLVEKLTRAPSDWISQRAH